MHLFELQKKIECKIPKVSSKGSRTEYKKKVIIHCIKFIYLIFYLTYNRTHLTIFVFF